MAARLPEPRATIASVHGAHSQRNLVRRSAGCSNAGMEPRAMSDTQNSKPRVVIVGGGFGGLSAAKSLAGQPFEITLIDRNNHHLFQPLLYQVATAALSPADIASPIRGIFRDNPRLRVLCGTVTAVDVAARRLIVDGRAVAYDALVIATGATHGYFGREELAAYAPGLKSVQDAT